MAVDSREQLIEYCLRNLGAPVIEINVDPDQVEDRVDEALQFYQEYHSDATVKTYFKHLVTETDKQNEWIPIPSSIIFLSKLFPVSSSSGNSMSFFDVKYQMRLNDIANLQHFAGDLLYYEQMQQHLSMLDMKLSGSPQVEFARRQGRLYIFGDFGDGDIMPGDYLVAEAFQIINPEEHTSIYNDKFIKKYTSALLKKQWGTNLMKFEGMQLPGGVTLNGRLIFEDAIQEIEKLETEMRLSAEMPPDFFVG
jgi:hypothetical protein